MGTKTNTEEYRGNDEAAYRAGLDEEKKKSEHKLVRHWRMRIDRAKKSLALKDRYEAAKRIETYLDGKGELKNRAIYLNYGLPVLEERNDQAMPAIPMPALLGKSDTADIMAGQTQSLLDIIFNSPDSEFESVMRELIWDDAKYRVGIGKLTWTLDYDSVNDDPPEDKELLTREAEHALIENEDPISAIVASNDIDHVHIIVHGPAIDLLPEGEAKEALMKHNSDHEDRAVTIRSEGVNFERVASDRFVWDADNTWKKRTWEAELRSALVRDLQDSGYKNVNPINCPPSNLHAGDTSNLVYEDMRCWIWEIHDRRSGDHFIMPARGPDEGLFIHKGQWVYGGIEVYHNLHFRKHRSGGSLGVATGELMIPVLDQLAEIDYNIERHTKEHANYKTLFPKGSMTNDSKSAFLDPERSFVELTSEAFAGMKEHKPPPIPQTLLDQRQTLLGELRRISGMDAQDVGVQQPGGVITATESGRRAAKGDRRVKSMQKKVGSFLSILSMSILRMYRRFGREAITVRVWTPLGPDYAPLNPADIPADLEVSLDVSGESDEDRSISLARFREYADWHLASGLPTDLPELAVALGQKYGIKRPERFQLENVPEGPENIQPTSNNFVTPPSGGPPQPQPAGGQET